ncbi:anthranilate phosphoribosyltransferase [Kribbella deserti]|uniref:Anthranilate phosphoribosyltransferase n=1 Tax=Kribbella deserti TaxID=1926257 RepID=A0ABV6QUJ3_9ACTN
MTSTTTFTDDEPASPAGITWAGVITRLLAREDLRAAEVGWAVARMVRGEASAAQIAGFLTAFRAKGETAAEIGQLVDALLAEAVTATIPGTTVDIAGTGGDRTGAVNVSTMAAIVAAAAAPEGVTVVKHGGRASSSQTGSADLLEHLGISLEPASGQVARTAVELGITYLFAPRFNPGLRHVSAVRRELATPTVFNLLGPLINPAHPAYQVVGVADRRMAPLVAEVLALRGRAALVVRGSDGLDKFTTTAASEVWIVHAGTTTRTVVDPLDLGIPRARLNDLRGGTAYDNARITRELLAGQRGRIRDVVLLNAAAVLAAATPTTYTHVTGLAEQLREGIAVCAEAIDSGAANALLNRWIHRA